MIAKKTTSVNEVVLLTVVLETLNPHNDVNLSSSI